MSLPPAPYLEDAEDSDSSAVIPGSRKEAGHRRAMPVPLLMHTTRRDAASDSGYSSYASTVASSSRSRSRSYTSNVRHERRRAHLQSSVNIFPCGDPFCGDPKCADSQSFERGYTLPARHPMQTRGSAPEKSFAADLTQDVYIKWGTIEKLNTELAVAWRQITLDELSRFRLWSNSQPADHWLRAAPDIQIRIAGLLGELCESLDDILPILSGEREGGEEDEPSDHETGPKDNDHTLPRSEISELWLMVGDIITNLLKVSVSLRKNNSCKEFNHAVIAATKAIASSTPTAWDTQHARHEFPKLEEREWLIRRLGESSMLRRRFLAYAREGEQRTAVGNHGPDGSEPAPSVTSKVAGKDSVRANKLDVRTLPSVCVNGKPAICPYCCDMVHYDEKQDWM